MSKHRSVFMNAPEDRMFGFVTNNVVVYSIRQRQRAQHTITLLEGTAVIIDSLDKQMAEIRKISDVKLTCNLDNEVTYQCPISYLAIIDERVWNLIMAVPSPQDRISIVKDVNLLNELLSIEKGCMVEVLSQSLSGIVTKECLFPELGPGIYFEVVLLDDKNEIQSGVISRPNYFSVNELRLADPMARKKSRASSNAARGKKESSSFDVIKKEEPLTYGATDSKSANKNNKFGSGNRIVWHSLGETRRGTICWRNQVGGTKVQVHFGSDCKEASCDRSRTQTVSIDEIMTEDECNRRKNTIVKQTKNDTVVEDLLGIDQVDDASTYKLSYASVLRGYDKKDEKERGSNVESRQSSDENLSYVNDFDIGSMVEVSVGGEPFYGVIKFIGPIKYGSRSPNQLVAGIELEEENTIFGHGYIDGVKYFDCAPNRGTFTMLSHCKKDSRFQDLPHKSAGEAKIPEDVGEAVVKGIVGPIDQLDNLHSLCGKYKGIQGHNNSCYLDATLFSMFTFTSVFDDLLYRPANDSDIQEYEEVQRVLREEVVNPLRRHLFVRSSHVMKLRTLLDNLTSVTGLTCEEKDPEEFLTSLVTQVLKAEPYLKLSSNQEAYYYQLFVEKDERLKLPTVQQLFQQSFITSDIKLKEVPSCLIIQMPRFGKSYKMYPRILPSQILDVTDVIENAPRVCSVCAHLAHYECKECFKDCYEEFECFSFCQTCVKTFHSHERRCHHKYTPIKIPHAFDKSTNYKSMPRHFMELFAVLCIETSHYVAFVKCGTGPDTPWCFFDSMADREGGFTGHNIPEMVLCPDLPQWLSDAGAKTFCEMPDDRHLDPYAKRLMCDAYMCLYQSTDVTMYR